MSCENVQELISLLLDGRLPETGPENALAHTRECRECGVHLASLQTQRAIMRNMAQAPVPESLAARLSVMASHERERQLARVSVRERVRRIGQSIDLAFDNLMRPVALPVTGGLVSALLLFGLMVPTLSFAHKTTGRQSYADAVSERLSRGDLFPATFPTGHIVTNPYGQVADADEDFPRIEPVDSRPSDFLNVVDLTIDETGKVVDWNVVRGVITADMKSVILFSSFEPATNMGVATSGKIRMVQFAPSATVHG
jgi:hypothetical protein